MIFAAAAVLMEDAPGGKGRRKGGKWDDELWYFRRVAEERKIWGGERVRMRVILISSLSLRAIFLRCLQVCQRRYCRSALEGAYR